MEQPYNQVYIGIFGGEGDIKDNNFTQRGIALYGSSKGGPLVVNAQSQADTDSATFAGAHIGYEWQKWSFGSKETGWSIVPAAELEGYYLKGEETGRLINPTTRVSEHTFKDSFPIHTGVFLANAVLSFNMPNMSRIHPYIGGGLGAAIISISNAYSAQINPAEPGINHFNSDPNASEWTLAAQSKVGLQLNITDHWRVFGEYRYMHLSPTHYVFGSTQYPTHVATTHWRVNFRSLSSSMGSVGIHYHF
jgi:opacity protein-like surface antigen